MKTKTVLFSLLFSLNGYAADLCHDRGTISALPCQLLNGGTVRSATRGNVAGVEINGRFWSNVLFGAYHHLDTEGGAPKACTNVGLKLPNNSDFEALTCAFGCQKQPYARPLVTEYGLAELHHVIPQTKGKRFWSSDFELDDPYSFSGDHGVLSKVETRRSCGGAGSPHRRGNGGTCSKPPSYLSVLCVE